MKNHINNTNYSGFLSLTFSICLVFLSCSLSARPASQTNAVPVNLAATKNPFALEREASVKKPVDLCGKHDLRLTSNSNRTNLIPGDIFAVNLVATTFAVGEDVSGASCYVRFVLDLPMNFEVVSYQCSLVGDVSSNGLPILTWAGQANLNHSRLNASDFGLHKMQKPCVDSSNSLPPGANGSLSIKSPWFGKPSNVLSVQAVDYKNNPTNGYISADLYKNAAYLTAIIRVANHYSFTKPQNSIHKWQAISTKGDVDPNNNINYVKFNYHPEIRLEKINIYPYQEELCFRLAPSSTNWPLFYSFKAPPDKASAMFVNGVASPISQGVVFTDASIKCFRFELDQKSNTKNIDFHIDFPLNPWPTVGYADSIPIKSYRAGLSISSFSANHNNTTQSVINLNVNTFSPLTAILSTTITTSLRCQTQANPSKFVDYVAGSASLNGNNSNSTPVAVMQGIYSQVGSGAAGVVLDGSVGLVSHKIAMNFVKPSNSPPCLNSPQAYGIYLLGLGVYKNAAVNVLDYPVVGANPDLDGDGNPQNDH